MAKREARPADVSEEFAAFCEKEPFEADAPELPKLNDEIRRTIACPHVGQTFRGGSESACKVSNRQHECGVSPSDKTGAYSWRGTLTSFLYDLCVYGNTCKTF